MAADRTVRRRVLVLTGIFPNRCNPTWGVHVFQNVRALAAHADVRVVAAVPWVPRRLARGRYRVYAGVPARDRWEGIETVYPRFVVVPRVGRFLHGYQLFASILPAVAEEVRRFRPDALLAYFAYPYGFAAVLFGGVFRLPVAVSCRGSDVNFMTAPRLQGGLIRRALKACGHVLVMSEDMRALVLGWGVEPAHVTVVSNGVDAVRFAPADRGAARASLGLALDARIAVCVSRLSHEKGIDVLIDAARVIGHPDVRIVVVGDGVERDALTAQAHAAGLAERITFAGTRPHDEIPRWLAAADVAVLPSRAEGMPNAVLEALAAGRPVVATAVGGTRELIHDPALGLLVPPDDPASLAKALEQALSSPWDAALIARSVSSRTWDAVGERTARCVDAAMLTGAGRNAHTPSEHTPWHAGTR
ncbi:MAG TPA: glycosyltransferase family 4 protein [Candidatus Krumholzibacteria bacterium]|nr:glycosyltransferase family 4 protein [Candidatus Krumholzibacteria bacterium]